jgi:hypothetical protein
MVASGACSTYQKRRISIRTENLFTPSRGKIAFSCLLILPGQIHETQPVQFLLNKNKRNILGIQK